VAHGSNSLHFFFMVIMLLVMILLYGCQAIYLSYDMGGAFGKVTMQMVEWWNFDYVMV
jgi:hypothetical protein